MTDRAGDYIASLFSAEDELLASLREEADRTGLPPIAISADEGRLLQVLLTSIGARRVLEVGTLGGYSAICMARALPSDGRVLSIEIEEKHAEFARRYIERAGAHRPDRGAGRPRARRAARARRRTLRRDVPRRRQRAAADVLRLGAAAGAARRLDHRRQRAVGRPRVRDERERREDARACASSIAAWRPIRACSGIIVPTHDGVAVAVVR